MTKRGLKVKIQKEKTLKNTIQKDQLTNEMALIILKGNEASCAAFNEVNKDWNSNPAKTRCPPIFKTANSSWI